MSEVVSFFVPGSPAPKGSWNAFWNKHIGRCVLVPQNTKAAKEWSQSIKAEAVRAGVERQMDGPVEVQIVFHLPKAKRTPSEWRYRDIKPDGDKLERLVLDALTDVAWKDDSQVCKLSWAKQYASNGETGAHLTIEPMRQTEGLF